MKTIRKAHIQVQKKKKKGKKKDERPEKMRDGLREDWVGDETEKEYKTIGLRRHQRSKRLAKFG